jgi:hypothetical protein
VKRGFVLVLWAFAQLPIGAGAACTSAGPEVATVSVRRVERTPYLNLYHVRVTVTNRANEAQAGKTLQFVDVVQYGNRLDDKGIPPLAPGESYSWTYVWKRSSDAGKGTTPLDFRYRPYPSSQISDACVANAEGINF